MRNPRTYTIALGLLPRFVKAMALGVFCAGLLLLDQQVRLATVIAVRQHLPLRLIFLLSIGISFGLGATLAEVL